MAYSYRQLTQFTKEALIAEYDRVARSTDQPALGFLRDELFRRELQEQNAKLERMTNQIRWLTVAITPLTLASTLAVGLQLFRR